MHPANAYPHSQGFPGGQGRTLLNSPSFSIVTGQGVGDPSKYVVKDQSGSPLLWVMDSAPPGHAQSNTGRSFSVKDAGQLDVLKIWYTPGPQQATTLLDSAGNAIGSVVIASKSVKEHKKGKDKEKDKDGKRQIVLQNSMNQALLTMSGKAKHGGGNVEMKIKSASPKTSMGFPGAYPTDHKNKDKKDKDKEKKDKDKKDKDKKNKEVAEVTGSVGMGFQVRITQSNLNLQERNNIVGLLISYMELEKQGSSMSQFPSGMMPQQQHPYYPQQTGMYQGGMPPSQGFPGQQPFQPGQQPFHPGQQPFHPGQQPFQPGQQPIHPGQPQMGFLGSQQSGQTYQGQYPPPHH